MTSWSLDPVGSHRSLVLLGLVVLVGFLAAPQSDASVCLTSHQLYTLISQPTSVGHLPIRVPLAFILLQASVVEKKLSVSVEQRKKKNREYQRKSSEKLN